jgi:hypothetical protein
MNWRGCLTKAVGSGIAVGFLTGLFIVLNSIAGFTAHARDVELHYRIVGAFNGQEQG